MEEMVTSTKWFAREQQIKKVATFALLLGALALMLVHLSS
jgi:hypothetical protein